MTIGIRPLTKPTVARTRPIGTTFTIAALLLATTPAMPSVVPFPVISPSVAYANEREDLLREANEIREQLSQAQSDYLAAIQQKEEAAGRAYEAREGLAEIQERLDGTQSELATVVKAQYKTSVDLHMMDLITSTDNLVGLTEAIDYLGQVEDKKTVKTTSVKELRDAQAEAVAVLEEAEELAEELATIAETRKADLEQRKADLQPHVDVLMSEVKSKIDATSGDSQLAEAMDFIENFQELTDTQTAILESAYATGYAGYFYCEAWAEYVYENAGVHIDGFASAYDCYDAYLVSEDYDVPVGALVWCSGGSPEYSHVGICVFNGGTGKDSVYIMDNEGARAHKAECLTTWEQSSATSIHNGKNGWFGWGYPTGVNLVG